jgi:hypothetical protein
VAVGAKWLARSPSCMRACAAAYCTIQTYSTRRVCNNRATAAFPAKKSNTVQNRSNCFFCLLSRFCVSNRQVCINNCIVIDSIPQQSYHSNSKFTSVERTPAGPLSDTVLVTYRTVCRTMQWRLSRTTSFKFGANSSRQLATRRS